MNDINKRIPISLYSQQIESKSSLLHLIQHAKKTIMNFLVRDSYKANQTRSTSIDYGPQDSRPIYTHRIPTLHTVSHLSIPCHKKQGNREDVMSQFSTTAFKGSENSL